MAFLGVETFEIGPFTAMDPLIGVTIFKLFTWTQAATDGGGTIATGIGTTNGNGKILHLFVGSNVKDKHIGLTFAVTTGVITLDINATAGPTAGWLLAVIKKT